MHFMHAGSCLLFFYFLCIVQYYEQDLNAQLNMSRKRPFKHICKCSTFEIRVDRLVRSSNIFPGQKSESNVTRYLDTGCCSNPTGLSFGDWAEQAASRVADLTWVIRGSPSPLLGRHSRYTCRGESRAFRRQSEKAEESKVCVCPLSFSSSDLSLGSF